MRKIIARLDGIQKSPHYYHSTYLQNLETEMSIDYEDLLKFGETRPSLELTG